MVLSWFVSLTSCRLWRLELNDLFDTCQYARDLLSDKDMQAFCLQDILVFFLSNLLMSYLQARIGILHDSFCSAVSWRPMIHCWVMQHELWGLFISSWMWSSTEMCYIFSSLIYTVKGMEKNVSETSRGQVQGASVGWKKKVVYFFLS